MAVYSWGRGEDVALGFWLAQAQLRSQNTPRPLNVTYVNINTRSKNLGCFRDKGDYRQPTASSIVVHFVKQATGHDYLWRVLHDGMVHDAFQCAVQAGVS